MVNSLLVLWAAGVTALIALIATFIFYSGRAAQPFPLPIDEARGRVESTVSEKERRKQVVAVHTKMEISRDAVAVLMKKNGEQLADKWSLIVRGDSRNGGGCAQTLGEGWLDQPPGWLSGTVEFLGARRCGHPQPSSDKKARKVRLSSIVA